MPSLTAPETKALYVFTCLQMELGTSSAGLLQDSAFPVGLNNEWKEPFFTIKKSTDLAVIWFMISGPRCKD